jgi:pimeloyl-ACP methyl ester carboxylesterase
MIPRTEQPPSLPSVEGVEHRFVQANGIRVHVAEAGEGPPLMLLHGGPQHWYAWRHVIPELAGEFRLICPDLRGFGWSDAPRDGYRIDQRARDMIGVLDALSIDKVQLAGHDWGGMLGFHMCFVARERIERFMAVSINHPWQRWWPGLSNDWRLWYQLLIVLPGLGPWISCVPAFLRFMLGLGVADPSATWAPGEREHYAALMQEPARALANSKMYRALWTPNGIKTMMHTEPLDLPILLVHGTRDFAIGPRIQRSGWQHHAPQMTLELIDGASHWLLNEHPKLIATRAREFFSLTTREQTHTSPGTGVGARRTH